jgi:diacylglycerol kinase (ATP)
MKPYLFINPKAGLLKGCKTAAEVKERLNGLETQPEITVGRTSAAMDKFIAKVKKDKPSHVYIAGGDGTIATIIKGLMDLDITFGFIPTGSMNNIAQSVGIGGDIDESVDIINKGRAKPMDMGKINGEIFIESIGIGLLAQIMDRVGEQDSKKEVLKIIQNTIAEIITTDTLPVKMKADEQELAFDTVWLTVTNTGRAAAAQVDPASSVHDEQLEIVYCEPIGVGEVGRYIIAFIRNSHIEEEKFHRVRAKHIELELPPHVKVHVDGVLKEWKKITVDVLPAAIKVFAP